MANKDPAFLFYPADFLVGCADLTMEERGQYITLMCLQHQKGRLNKRTIDLSIPNISSYVLDKFDIDDNGLYYNKRLDFEINKRAEYSKSRSENVKKRWEKEKSINTYVSENEYICNTKADTQPIHSENENINENINKIKDDKVIDLFNILWEIYPRKVNKQYALQCFKKLSPDADLTETIKKAIEKAKRWKQWEDDKYIPHFSTYLNQRRWEDVIPDEQCSSFDFDDFFQHALERSAKVIKERANE